MREKVTIKADRQLLGGSDWLGKREVFFFRFFSTTLAFTEPKI